MPGHELCLKERWNLNKKSCSNGWNDVIQGPIPLRVKIMVIVRKTDGKKPFYGHCDHHVNRTNKSDAVERIMKPRKYVEKVVMVKVFPRCSYCFHDSKDDMQAVASNQAWNNYMIVYYYSDMIILLYFVKSCYSKKLFLFTYLSIVD